MLADRDHQMLTWTRIGVVVTLVGAAATVVQCAGSGRQAGANEISKEAPVGQTATQGAASSTQGIAASLSAGPDPAGASVGGETDTTAAPSAARRGEPAVTAVATPPGSNTQPAPLTFRHRADSGVVADSSPAPAPVPLSLEHRGQ